MVTIRDTQELAPVRVVYLHGLGSSPESPKARLFLNHFEAFGHPTLAPNLSIPSLQNLSPEAAIGRIVELLESPPVSPSQPCSQSVLIASSLGAFLGVHSFLRLSNSARQRIRCLVLLAPVLYPWDVDEPIITPAIEAKWAASGDFPVEDGASGKMVALHHDFLVELRRLEKTELPDNKPTLIVHGRRDEMVPYNHSLKFVSSNRSACLESLDDGHQLMAQPEFLLKTVVSFIGKCG